MKALAVGIKKGDSRGKEDEGRGDLMDKFFFTVVFLFKKGESSQAGGNLQI